MSTKKNFSPSHQIRRKVQVVGGNTVTVSLPRSWANKNRLGKESGQEQEISMRYMADGSLLISPANANLHTIERSRLHKIEQDVGIERIKRILIADFMGGIDLIHLTTNSPLPSKFLHEIRNFVDNRLLGFDLIEHKKGFDVINMTQSPKFHVDRLLEIIRIQSNKMMENCYQWLKDHEIDRKELVQEMRRLESSLDKRSNQMIRTLQLSILDFWMAENVNLPMVEILYWSSTTIAAEYASDLAFAIAQIAPLINLDDIDDEILDDLYQLGKNVTNQFSKAMKAFIDHDDVRAHEVLEDQSKLSTTQLQSWPISSAHRLDGNMILILRHMEKIGVYSRKISEAVIDCEAARIAYGAVEL